MATDPKFCKELMEVCKNWSGWKFFQVKIVDVGYFYKLETSDSASSCFKSALQKNVYKKVKDTVQYMCIFS